MRAFHVTYADNFDSIVEEGLHPRRPIEHNWTGAMLDRQPAGVYITVHEKMAHRWASCNISYPIPSPEPGKIILVLEIPDEMDCWNDPCGRDGDRYVPETIPPSCIVDVVVDIPVDHSPAWP